MAQIVPFRTGTAREMAEAETESGSDGSAEIIIFPGVRRERHVEAPAAELHEVSEAPRKRDLLVLPD
ncbi:MAG TPA: hypothetical protein VG758_07445 [Hyphomicrobiaceae bacterium]|jgi:hypothetical protein|nr:hypothetical protein [Hyphomicrobiaceae bacterium]